jgi:hypothetical protein
MAQVPSLSQLSQEYVVLNHYDEDEDEENVDPSDSETDEEVDDSFFDELRLMPSAEANSVCERFTSFTFGELMELSGSLFEMTPSERSPTGDASPS